MHIRLTFGILSIIYIYLYTRRLGKHICNKITCNLNFKTFESITKVKHMLCMIYIQNSYLNTVVLFYKKIIRKSEFVRQSYPKFTKRQPSMYMYTSYTFTISSNFWYTFEKQRHIYIYIYIWGAGNVFVIQFSAAKHSDNIPDAQVKEHGPR